MNPKITQFRSMNLAVCDQSLEPFEDSEKLKKFYEDCGLTGLEVIRTWDSDQGKILPGMVHGVHLFFHIFWMDWWKRNFDRLDQEFDSREQWLEYFGGTEHGSYLKSLRDDMEYAEKIGARYVVFHVSESTMEECFSCQFRYSDKEVVETAAEVIRELFAGREYSFDFLVENLWWSGFTLRDIGLTEYLLRAIPTERKGIMLDTGHYMNTNPQLRSAEEAVSYLHEMADAYEKAGLLHYFKGMHLHMSLSGEYRKETMQSQACNPEKIAALPFYEKYRVVTEHVRRLDCHQPFTGTGVRELVERIAPVYLTYEFQPESPEEYARMARCQSRELGILSEKD